MAVIAVSLAELAKLTGLDNGKLADQLGELGLPNERDGEILFVEITPNRPDLLSIEGLARALAAFNGRKMQKYAAKKSDLRLKVDGTVGPSRPYIVSALVKNVQMDGDVLKSMIQLQEKLHDTVGRKRRKVAIGLHNAAEVVFPLTYKFVKDVEFTPLGFERKVRIKELLETHPKGVAYAHLVGPEYPVLCDQKGVISLPPIINSERTRVSEATMDILIDVTGNHLQTLEGVLNILACALADRGGAIHSIKVGKIDYPKLGGKKIKLDAVEINKLLGENFTKSELSAHLKRMGWEMDGRLTAVAPYRMDVSNFVDVAEDVAIAHGYNNFKQTMPNFFTSGNLGPFNEGIRGVLLGAGFMEVVNYVLNNSEKNQGMGSKRALGIVNPKTEDFTLVRSGVISSLLENLGINKNQELPIKIFDVGRVYDGVEKNCLGFAICSEINDFAEIRGVLQRIGSLEGLVFEFRKIDRHPFIKGRGADIYSGKTKVGCIGEIAPETLSKFGLQTPTSVCEIEVK